MSRSTRLAAVLGCWVACTVAFAADRLKVVELPLTNVGRPATSAEVKAWDIDVRPDFKGLPKGSGSVAHGQDIWEGKCASCHGTFGESNEVFTPIVGGTTKEDIKTGHVAALTNGTVPQRTTLMKASTVSTLWDYIHRAMPWNAPKSLSNDDVYAVLAYILNMGDIVDGNFTLNDKNIAEVQAKMPNRNGMTTDHGLWDVKGKPDVKDVACMKDCVVGDKLGSSLPEAARGANGSPANQTRSFGATHGLDFTSAGKIAAAQTQTAPAATPAGAAGQSADVPALLASNGCVACHGTTNKIVGPAFNAVRDQYKGDAGAPVGLATKIKAGGSGVWGAIPMPPQPDVKDAEVKAIVQWILDTNR